MPTFHDLKQTSQLQLTFLFILKLTRVELRHPDLEFKKRAQGIFFLFKTSIVH